jgi:hypothetical protein
MREVGIQQRRNGVMQSCTRPRQASSARPADRANVLTPNRAVSTIGVRGESLDLVSAATMLRRVKSALVYLALLISTALLFGTADQAMAHAGHDHGSARPERVVNHSPPVVQSSGATVDEVLVLLADGGVTLDNQSLPNQPAHQGNCCCGSFACHAGVAVFVSISHPHEVGQRLALPPVLAPVPSRPGGIERPPRTDTPR